MIRAELRVYLDDDDAAPFVVRVDGRDVRAWEAEHGLSFLTEQTSYTQMTWLAWHHASTYDGRQMSWEEFDRRCLALDEVKADNGQVRPGPTRKPRSVVSASG